MEYQDKKNLHGSNNLGLFFVLKNKLSNFCICLTFILNK